VANGSAAASAAPAEMFVAAGANYVALDFILIEEAEGDLLRMIEQVRGAIAWVYAKAESFGADSQHIYLAGHSSGSHLGACALITDWSRDFGLPADVIKAACLSSGM
jgi:arylformamidase